MRRQMWMDQVCSLRVRIYLLTHAQTNVNGPSVFLVCSTLPVVRHFLFWLFTWKSRRNSAIFNLEKCVLFAFKLLRKCSWPEKLWPPPFTGRGANLQGTATVVATLERNDVCFIWFILIVHVLEIVCVACSVSGDAQKEISRLVV